MTIMSRLFAVVGLAVLTLPTVASADPGDWFKLRDQRNDARAEQGAASGSLTNREGERVDNREQHADNLTDRALADGDLTVRERRKLDRVYDRDSRFLYRQKHDRQSQ
jgi:hypothetical protein